VRQETYLKRNLLEARDAAQYLSSSVSPRKATNEQAGPNFVRLGAPSAMQSDLDTWMSSSAAIGWRFYEGARFRSWNASKR